VDIFDFTKKHPKPETPETLADKEAGVDLDLNRFLPPGGASPMDMVGVDAKAMRGKRDEFLRLRERVRRDMRDSWRCTECRRVWRGRDVRVVIRGRPGVEVLVCPDKRCDGPVVRVARTAGER
jgi:hypothetical protein